MKIINSILAFLFLTFAYAAYNHSASFAQTASILPQAETQFLDNNGNPVASGTVDFYIPNSSTRKTTWQDANMSVANQNPLTLDAAGRATIYGYGGYRQVVKDKNGNLIWDRVTNSYAIPNGQVTTGDGDAVGTVKPWSGVTAPSQYAFAYGQELSRTTYSDLLSAITVSQNVNCVLGTNVLSGVADTSQIPIGAKIEVACVSGSVTVTAKTTNTFTVSANSISTLTAVRATIFPFGNGNGSTTFNVPDLRGRLIAGRDNMGGIAASRLTSTYFANASAIGATGGSQSHTLAQAELPNVNLNVVIPPTNILAGAVNAIGVPVGASLADTSSTPNVFGSYSSAQYGSLAFPGGTYNTTALGSGTAFSIVQPTMTLNYIIKVTPDITGLASAGVQSIQGMAGIITCGAGLTCTGQVIQAGSVPYYNTALFSTRSEAIATNIPTATETLYLNGYYAVGDAGKGAVYIKGTASTAGAGFTSADGQNWKLSNNAVTPGMFGAIGDNISDDTTSLTNTCAYINSGQGSIINGTPGANYKIWSAVPSSGTALCMFTASGVTYNANGSTITSAMPFGGSSTSQTIVGSGNVTFTTTSGAGWNVGDPIIVYVTNNANEYTATAYMIGTVASYSGTTLTVTVSSSGGTPGTYSTWTFLPNVVTYVFLFNGTASQFTFNDFTGVKTSGTRTYGAGVNWFASLGTGTGLYINRANLTGGNCGICLQSADLTTPGFTRWHFDGVLDNVYYGIGLEAVGSYGDFNIQTSNMGRSVILYNVSNINGTLNSTATQAGVIDDVVIEVQGGASFSNNTTDNIWIKYVNKKSTVGRNMVTVINYPSAAAASAIFRNINIDYDIDLSNIVAPFGYVLAMGGTKADGTCGDPNITYQNFNLSGVIRGNITSGLTTSMSFLPQTLNGICGNFNGTSTGTLNVTNLYASTLSLPITVGAGATVNLANLYAPSMTDLIAEGSPNQYTISQWNTTLFGLNSQGTLPANRATMFEPRKGSNYAISVDKGAFEDWFDANGTRQGQISGDAGSGGLFIINAITKGLFQTAGINSFTWTGTEFGPAIDNVAGLGDATHRFTNAYIVSLTKTCAAGNFISSIAADGTPSCTAGSASIIINDANMQGDLLATNIAAPSTPSIGKTRLYVDSTQKIFTSLNDVGTKSVTVVPNTATANNFLTGLGADGTLTKAQPTCSNLSGVAASCSTDATNASNISSGTLPSGRLTGAYTGITSNSYSSQGQYKGTTTNDSATAGNIGEVISSSVAIGSAIGLATGTVTNVTSIPVPAGDWVISGAIDFTGPAGTTVTNLAGSISTTSATFNGTAGQFYSSGNMSSAPIFNTGLGVVGHAITPFRASLSSATIYYLVARCDFAVSACSAYGSISATRTR